MRNEIDRRTGLVSAITGESISESIRSDCAAINRARTRGLLEAAEQTSSEQPVSTDVWAAAFAGRTESLRVPVVPLDNLGLAVDRDGFITSSSLRPLVPGNEAQPFLDEDLNVVYKLFDLRSDGSVGLKLRLNFQNPECFEIDYEPAIWTDILEKLSFLNLSGGLITEIVGLSSCGNYLISKQPRAYGLNDFESDRSTAIIQMRGIFPVGAELRSNIFISFSGGTNWIVGDVHDRNVMIDSNENPCVIDALVAQVSPTHRQRLNWLEIACQKAENYRVSGLRPLDIFDVSNDDDL